MAASTTPRSQVNAVLLLAMLAVGQVDAVSKSTAAAGIATLAIAAHGARDDGSRAISVHSAGRQVFANNQTQEANGGFHAYNQSLVEASTGECLVPETMGGWFKMTVNQAIGFSGENIPFVGVVLSAHDCAVAIKNRCTAGTALRNAVGAAGHPNSKEWKAQLDDLEIEDVAVLQCQRNQAGKAVFQSCILGFALSFASDAAACATGGASACATGPLRTLLHAATSVGNCVDDFSDGCGLTEIQKEGDTVGLITQAKVSKLKRFKFWLSECAAAVKFKLKK